MKYIKIYEDTEDPDLVGEEMNALFLEDMIKALHKDGFKTARISTKDPKVIEAEVSEANQAKAYVQEYLDIILSMTGADLNANFNSEEKKRYFEYLKGGESNNSPRIKEVLINGKLDLLKLFLIMAFYIFGGLFFVLSKMSDSLWKENWWYLLVFFAPVFAIRFLAPTLKALNTPFPLAPKDEAWMETGKRLTRTLVWFFWIIAIPMIYLFFRTNELQWNSVISGDKETIFKLLIFFAPIMFIGASVYLFKVIFHRRVYLNPAAFSPEEIEKINKDKERSIAEIKNKL